MTQPCIISVAITGSLPRKKDNPAVPITVSEQVESTQAAFEAGATLVHLHVRNDDETPSSEPDRFARVLEGIRKHAPGIITQVSTGGRSGAGKERGGMLALRPDMASLATGSVNFPTRVYDNPPDLVDWLAAEMKACAVKPEIEAFDLSMIFQAVAMQQAGKIDGALHIQFVMGIKNAMPVDREVLAFYVHTLRRLAPDATWTGAGIGRDQLTMARWSLELGGHCRTGLEDNVRLDKHTLAPSNAALVSQVRPCARNMGAPWRQWPRRARSWGCHQRKSTVVRPCRLSPNRRRAAPQPENLHRFQHEPGSHHRHRGVDRRNER